VITYRWWNSTNSGFGFSSRDSAFEAARRACPDCRDFYTAEETAVDLVSAARGCTQRVLDEYLPSTPPGPVVVVASEEKVADLDRRIAAVLSEWVRVHGLESRFREPRNIERHRIYDINVGDIVTTPLLCSPNRERLAEVVGTYPILLKRMLRLRCVETGFEFVDHDKECVLVEKRSQ
jgi:hypothetical protein